MDVSRQWNTVVVLGLMGLALLALNVATFHYSLTHPDEFPIVMFLLFAVFALSFVEVRLERGRLTLSGVAIGATAVLLNPLNATIVTLALTPATMRRGVSTILGNAFAIPSAACLSSVIAIPFHSASSVQILGRLLTLIAFNLISAALIAVVLSARSG